MPLQTQVMFHTLYQTAEVGYSQRYLLMLPATAGYTGLVLDCCWPSVYQMVPS